MATISIRTRLAFNTLLVLRGFRFAHTIPNGFGVSHVMEIGVFRPFLVLSISFFSALQELKCRCRGSLPSPPQVGRNHVGSRGKPYTVGALLARGATGGQETHRKNPGIWVSGNGSGTHHH